MLRVIVVLICANAAQAVYSQPRPLAPAELPPRATVAERAEFYQRVASEESTAALEQLARDAAAAPQGTVQQPQLEIIVERYFELDPSAAVRFAGELGRSGAPDFVALLYERLARDDANAALSALSQVDDSAEAGIAAMAIFRGLGGGERAFELVAASLYGSAAEQFRADALVRLARTAPAKALDEALALADLERRNRLATTVVGLWANDAPSEAMAAVQRVQDPALRSALRDAVLRSWGDPDSLAAYLETLDPESQLAALSSGALYRLVQADPRRAAEIAAALPPGEERSSLLRQIGTSYAQRDAGAALAWAQSLDPPDPTLIGAVLRGIAFKDPVRAFDLVGSVAEPARSQAYGIVIGVPIADAAQFSALGDRVLRLKEEPLRTSLAVTLIGSWANRPGNMGPALNWMLANGAAVPTAAFERVGLTYAHSDPSAAAAYVDRVPSGARAAWISAVAQGYATTDPQSAAAFLERFRGDQAYDAAALAAVQPLAASDPAAAARLLASVGTRGTGGIGPEFAIARNWAQRDPAAAASWALDLPLMSRGVALPIVAGAWALQDPGAVREWALRVPPGEKKDAALAAVMRSRGNVPPDPALLGAFSDDRARQAAIMNTLVVVAQTDPAAARRLLDAHITDPKMRNQAEQMIDGFASGAVPTPTGVFGVPPGMINGPPPFGVTGARPGGVYAPTGQQVVVIGPDGQPISVRSPAPGLMPVPMPAGPLPFTQQVVAPSSLD